MSEAGCSINEAAFEVTKRETKKYSGQTGHSGTSGGAAILDHCGRWFLKAFTL